MFKEELYISKDYKLKDYLNLNFKIDSDEEVWKKAISIFVSRIKGRYFDAIDKLLENEMYKYAFSIMALECLLIDTFVKFRAGPNETKSGECMKNIFASKKYKGFEKMVYYKENRKRFKTFLEEFILDNDKRYLSERFYQDIRCSVVHFGSTENKSRLTCDSSRLITILENNDISVDVVMMNEKLKEYFNQYIEELENNNEEKLRKNFVLAMDYLCGLYDNCQ